MKNAMWKNLTQSIRRSLGRYIAIVAIIALGASIFVGLLMTKSDMVATGQVFMDRQNMFDLRLANSYGWSEESLEAVSGLDGIEDAEGVIYLDLIVRLDESDTDSVYRVYSMPENVNKIELRAGRMPESPNECLADGFYMDESIIGTTVRVSDTNEEDSLDAMTSDVYTIVGTVATPLYMDMNRGTTSVGNGSIENFLYIPRSGFDVDYYTEIHVTLPGEHQIYTAAYNEALDEAAERLEPDVEKIAQERFDKILAEAEEEYADGYAEYLDGVRELEEGKLEAEQELADAYRQLTDGEQELRENEEKLTDGEKQLQDGWKTLADNEKKLADSKKELEKQKKDTYAQMDEAQKELDSNAKLVADNLAQVESGLKELDSGLAQLDDGLDQIKDGLDQLASGQIELEDGIEQVQSGLTQIRDGLALMEESLDEAGLTMEQVAAIQSMIDSAQDFLDRYESAVEEFLREHSEELKYIQSGLDEVEKGIQQLNEQLQEYSITWGQLDDMLQLLRYVQNMLEEKDVDIDTLLETSYNEIAQFAETLGLGEYMDQLTELLSQLGQLGMIEEQYQTLLDTKAELEATLEELLDTQLDMDEMKTQLEGQYQELLDTLEELLATREELLAAKAELESAQKEIDQGYKDLNAGRAEADQAFADAEKQIADGEKELSSAKKTLREKERELADGKTAIADGWTEINDGWKEYYDGKAEAEAEIADGEAELADAAVELAEARKEIDDMEDPEVFLLDRTTNVGYTSLDSASDIVQGVAKVFPAFFLLVAALVCITTMTRMIDEERTQIGTLKALGYSNNAIISKYLLYAGSGAIVGCGLGVLLGSVAFPTILWEAYKIMLYITDGIVLQVNWWLCGAVVGAYTSVMLLVTWYCCRRALREEPAELIRPKAPEAGKKILVEYLPFWHRISFLNKVTIRNIFRYRQRLAMMLVGIGGCTALLVTGFGLRDSIVNVVDYQFQDVTVYDMTVYFSEDQDPQEQEEFIREVGDSASIMFYHQSSIELDHENQTKEIYLIAADSGVEEFMDFHTGEEPLERPGTNEVLLTVGIAEMLGIHVGDRITMRNSDMQTLELTISGIYDNYVYNYAVIAPETIEAQWGEPAELQMAFVKAGEGQDVYALSADIAGMDGVMNVSVSEDLAFMVSNMMEALDLVVWVIVICAGALAVIVLYNLTNININERIREIATIKVLGFRADETAMYVFKENLSLTGIGAVFGLGLGYLLLLFVMSQIKIDFVWFKTVVAVPSYLWALLLTVLSAIIVDCIFYFKLDQINMAEALKSVE